MKIEIDNEGASYQAKITIDGRTVEVGVRAGGKIQVTGVASHETETLGFLILNLLGPVVIRALQAEAFAAEAEGYVSEPVTFTWQRLNRGAYLAAKEQLS